jgi:hypothetical protein
VSLTVITAVQLDTLPLVSVTVIVIVTVPTSAHVNAVWLNTYPPIVQLSYVNGGPSVKVLFTSVELTVPLPVASKFNVYGLQYGCGADVSLTVTCTVQLDTFPLVSVTVIVIVTDPISAHVNELLLNPYVLMLQLSLDPASTVLVTKLVTVGAPIGTGKLSDNAKYITVLVHIATGAIVSLTVTCTVQLDTFPYASAAVSVTVCGFDAISLQLNNDFDRLNVGVVVHASLTLDNACTVVKLTVPDTVNDK